MDATAYIYVLTDPVDGQSRESVQQRWLPRHPREAVGSYEGAFSRRGGEAAPGEDETRSKRRGQTMADKVLAIDPASIEEPLFFDWADAEIATHASQLTVTRCAKAKAVELTRRWHSRLPNTQDGPWVAAYAASYRGVIYAVALWNSPSARTLPDDWLELRRMACSPIAPRNTPSYMIARMERDIRESLPHIVKLISYQDTAVHQGTIYKASNWTAEWHTPPRVRDRTDKRRGTSRSYRWDINTTDTAAAGKIRWAKVLATPRKNIGA